MFLSKTTMLNLALLLLSADHGVQHSAANIMSVAVRAVRMRPSEDDDKSDDSDVKIPNNIKDGDSLDDGDFGWDLSDASDSKLDEISDSWDNSWDDSDVGAMVALQMKRGGYGCTEEQMAKGQELYELQHQEEYDQTTLTDDEKKRLDELRADKDLFEPRVRYLRNALKIIAMGIEILEKKIKEEEEKQLDVR